MLADVGAVDTLSSPFRRFPVSSCFIEASRFSREESPFSKVIATLAFPISSFTIVVLQITPKISVGSHPTRGGKDGGSDEA